MGINYYTNMRLLLFFDLPVKEKDELQEYQKFHNHLLRNGYIMIQYSVYLKSINISAKVKDELNKFKNHIPKNGNIRFLSITEKQYNDMVVILGNKNVNEIFNNEERYLKI